MELRRISAMGYSWMGVISHLSSKFRGVPLEREVEVSIVGSVGIHGCPGCVLARSRATGPSVASHIENSPRTFSIHHSRRKMGRKGQQRCDLDKFTEPDIRETLINWQGRGARNHKEKKAAARYFRLCTSTGMKVTTMWSSMAIPAGATSRYAFSLLNTLGWNCAINASLESTTNYGSDFNKRTPIYRVLLRATLPLGDPWVQVTNGTRRLRG